MRRRWTEKMEEVCYTMEAALEKAVELERNEFDSYKKAFLAARNATAKDLLKDLALDELKHKYLLERAIFEEMVSIHPPGLIHGPEMKLTLLFEDRPLREDSTEQDVLLHAMHREKRAVEFYSGIWKQCHGAPMESIFKKLAEDEEAHLSRMEELYESIYLREM